MKNTIAKSSLRILHLEDKPRDHELVAETLAAAGLACQFTYAQTQKEFEAALARDEFDLILGDFTLPSYDGLAALKAAHRALPKVPFIFVSGTIGEERAIDSLKNGATDYVLKQRLERLVPAVERALAEAEERRKRREAEEALRASEEKYRSLFEGSHDAIMILEPPAWSFTAGNPATVKMFGANNEEEFISHGPGELSPDRQPDGRASAEKFKEMIETALREGSHFFEWTHRRIGGEEFPANVLLTRMEQRGKVILQATVRDITERKRTEEALRGSQQLLAGIINAIPVRVFWKDENLVYLGCNAAFARDAGFADPKDIIGKDDCQMVWREQAEAYRSDDRQVIASGQSKLIFEETLTTPEGKTITVLSSKLPLRNAKGEIVGVLGTYMDITERKRMRESHDRLAMAVEQSAESVVITDTEGTILYANPAFEKTSGYTRAEALGQNPRVLKSGKQDAEFYTRMWETLRRGTTWSGHLINRRKDGTHYEEEANISPLVNAAGTIINYVAVKRDVTHEVQLEAQFRQAQKMEAIGTLAGGVAHDFNNMLAVISMQVDLLKSSGGLSDEQLNMADDIGIAVERGAALTRQLLLFSRRESFKPRDLDLSESIANTTKMLRRILGETIEVQLKLAEHPMFIHADAGMMDQVLMNLCVNARDAMPNGGQLLIETAGVELDELAMAQSIQARPGSFVCLSVGDNGSGIPPEVLPRIFEPFFTTKSVGKGTGLGLATVFGIVQQHQGWISVIAKPAGGTTFRIYLPQLAKITGAMSSAAATTAVRGGNETILLVEDEPSLRVSVRLALARLGYRILEAPTGVKAQEVWKANRDEIRLLLTDLVMPDGMSGIDLAQRLLQEDSELKVIYMSGYSLEVAGKKFPMKEGINFLTKPFEAHRLAQTIRANLDRHA